MSNGAPPSAPPSTPPAAPPVVPPAAPAEPSAAPAPPTAPAEKSPEDIEKELSDAKKKAAVAAGMAVVTEGAAAPEAIGEAAKVKSLEAELKKAKEREEKASSKAESAPAGAVSSTKSEMKKILAQPAMMTLLGIIAFLYFRFSGYATISNWIGISVLGSVVLGVIFKEPKKGFVFMFLPFIIGFLDYLKMLTPMNTILAVCFQLTLTLFIFDVARKMLNNIITQAVYLAGGIMIFFLSAWAQLQLGTSFPQIITTILIICYFMFVLVTQKKFLVKFLAIMLNICFFLVIFSAPTLVAYPDSAFYNAIISQRSAWTDMYSSGILAGKQVVKGVETQYLYALGDYEEGVEAQSERPLGVFLENVGVTAKFVSRNDIVDIFARLRAETFKTDKKLIINVACYPEDKKELSGKISPKASFEVEEYESQDIDCIIDAGDLGEAATHNIFLETSFSFTTGSFLTTYFMPQDSIRAYMRQHPEPGANPLDQWQITNRNPIAVFTGGPLKIGLGIGSQPVPLTNESYGPTLGITLDRNWLEGDLLNVSLIKITVPPGVCIEDVDGIEIGKCEPSDKEQSYVIEDKFLTRILKVREPPVILPKTIRVHTKIDNAGYVMAGAPLAIRSFKVDVNYDFRIRKQVDVTVRAEKGAPSV